MWRYILAAFLVLTFSYAHADSTKQITQFDLLTDVATDDAVWVYDVSSGSLKRITADEFVGGYLFTFGGAVNQLLQTDGVGNLSWTSIPTGAGTGVTTFDCDSGTTAESRFSDGATRISLVGAGGTTVTASGNTVTVTTATNFATKTELTDHTEEVSGTSLTGTAAIGVETTEVVSGGASKFFVYSGTTLTGEMLAGGMIFSHADSPVVIGVPGFSGSTPYFVVYDMTGSGVTVQTTDGDPLYNGDEAGTALWVNAGNSRHSASFTCNVESGSCTYVVTLGVTGTGWGTQ